MKAKAKEAQGTDFKTNEEGSVHEEAYKGS